MSWTCPKCGHRFVSRNQWHSCGNWDLAHHFSERPEHIRSLFDRFREMVESCGPVTVESQKTRIVFTCDVRFASAIPRMKWLEVGLWLTRRATHPALHQAETLASHTIIHRFHIGRREQLDGPFERLIEESYRVGWREHLAPAPAPAAGAGGSRTKRASGDGETEPTAGE